VIADVIACFDSGKRNELGRIGSGEGVDDANVKEGVPLKCPVHDQVPFPIEAEEMSGGYEVSPLHGYEEQ
jgi:hypothetical protein